jgi:hypothetical protein
VIVTAVAAMIATIVVVLTVVPSGLIDVRLPELHSGGTSRRRPGCRRK